MSSAVPASGGRSRLRAARLSHNTPARRSPDRPESESKSDSKSDAEAKKVISVLSPPSEIASACAVLHNNVLYVYSPSAFQSLPLRAGGRWKKLAGGVSVKGGKCVKTDGSDPSLLIVGGQSPDDAFTGIQKYSFSKKQWETITPSSLVTKQRIHHAASTLPGENAILVFGGSQDGGSGVSSQTFVLDTTAPYSVQAFNSAAPPTRDAYLTPWGAGTAALFGGEPAMSTVYAFKRPDGFFDAKVAMPAIPPTAKPIFIDSTDGSRSMLLLDSASKPARIGRYQLLGPGGKTLSTEDVSTDLNDTGSKSKKDKRLHPRDLVVDNALPDYDAKYAPILGDEEFAVAESGGQVVVVSSAEGNPVAVYNHHTNAWLDPAELLAIGTQSQEVLSISSSQVTFPAPTATSGDESSSDTNSDSGGGSKKGTILGAVLGTFGGLILIALIVVLFLYLRRPKKGNSAGLSEKNVSAPQPSDRSPPAVTYEPRAEGRDSSTFFQAPWNTNTGAPQRPPRPDETNLIANPALGRYNPHQARQAPADRNSDSSATRLVDAGSAPGMSHSKPTTAANGFPQITVDSTATSLNPSPVEPSHLSREDGSSISLGSVPSGIVSTAVVAPGMGYPQQDGLGSAGPNGQRGSGWSRYFDGFGPAPSTGTTNTSGMGASGAYMPGTNLSVDFTLVPSEFLNAKMNSYNNINNKNKVGPAVVSTSTVIKRPVDSPQEHVSRKHMTTFGDMTMPHPPSVVLPPIPLGASTLITNSKGDPSSLYAIDTLGPYTSSRTNMSEGDTFGTGFGFGQASASLRSGFGLSSDGGGGGGYSDQSGFGLSSIKKALAAHEAGAARNSGTSAMTVFPGAEKEQVENSAAWGGGQSSFYSQHSPQKEPVSASKMEWFQLPRQPV